MVDFDVISSQKQVTRKVHIQHVQQEGVQSPVENEENAGEEGSHQETGPGVQKQFEHKTN